MTGHRLARRIVDEMNLSGELARRDIVTKVDRRLEDAMIGRIDVIVPALDLHEAGGLSGERGLLLRQDAEMRKEAPDPGLDQRQALAIDRAARAEFAAEIGHFAQIRSAR